MNPAPRTQCDHVLVDLKALPFPVLFADIGGTNARFAVLSDAHAELRHFDTVETKAFSNQESHLHELHRHLCPNVDLKLEMRKTYSLISIER